MTDETAKQAEEKDPVEELEKNLDEQRKALRDLIEYLERKDIIPAMDYATFEDWRSELDQMRRDELRQREIQSRIKFLEDEGYVVAKNKHDLDAKILEHWTTSKERLNLNDEDEDKKMT